MESKKPPTLPLSKEKGPKTASQISSRRQQDSKRATGKAKVAKSEKDAPPSAPVSASRGKKKVKKGKTSPTSTSGTVAAAVATAGEEPLPAAELYEAAAVEAVTATEEPVADRAATEAAEAPPLAAEPPAANELVTFAAANSNVPSPGSKEVVTAVETTKVVAKVAAESVVDVSDPPASAPVTSSLAAAATEAKPTAEPVAAPAAEPTTEPAASTEAEAMLTPSQPAAEGEGEGEAKAEAGPEKTTVEAEPKAEAEIKPEAEAEAEVTSEHETVAGAELKEPQEAEAGAKAEAVVEAEVTPEAGVKADSESEAEAEAKAKLVEARSEIEAKVAEAKAEVEAKLAEVEAALQVDAKPPEVKVEAEPKGEAEVKPPAVAAASGGGMKESAADIIQATLPLVSACAEEAAKAAEEDSQYLDPSEAAWEGCEGSPALDAALGEADGDPLAAPVRLVDARFLISLAKKGGKLVRRQDLPEGAFFSTARLRQESLGGTPDSSLRLLACLMPALTDGHPDPEGKQLVRLARMLSSFVEEDNGSYAVYLSYCSLLQPGASGEARTAEESALYATSLQTLPAIYGHEAIPVLVLDSMPEEMDPTGATAKAFASRGWAHFEYAISNLAKPPAMLLNLSKFKDSGEGEVPMLDDVLLQCKAPRPPPFLPADLKANLATMAFADPADAAALAPVYDSFFAERFLPIDALLYDDNDWGDEEVTALCKVLTSVELPNCTSLWLSRNDLGDAGMQMVAEAVRQGALLALEEVHLHGNPHASFKVREEIQAARDGLKVHYDGMGGGRTNHKQ